MIDTIRTVAFESVSADGQYSFTIGGGGSTIASPRGEILGIKILDFLPDSANTYVKLTDSVVTGTTGTILDLKPSGTTPKFYPVRALTVSYDGVYLGSPAQNAPFPIVGDLTLTVGSIGSPIVFSGIDIFIKK